MMDEKTQARIFHEWLDRHRGLLFKVIRAYSRGAHDGDDLFQEIAIQLWHSIPGYGGRCAETTWIYRVAFFVAMRWSSGERRRLGSHLPLGEEHLSLLATEPSDPMLDWLYEEIGRLSEGDRTLTLLMLDGYEYSEIAEILGLSTSNVGVKLNRIKKHLTTCSEGRSGRWNSKT